MRELHLFAGIGGGILGGMLLGHTCVGAVEINPFAQKVLRARQANGILPQFPIYDDVRTFNGYPYRGRVDVVCGGFPCQPWSPAGKRLGVADRRHLWPDMARIVGEARPRFVFAENVSRPAFELPLSDLQAMGYRVAPLLTLSAEDLGAPFRRRRNWLLAADANPLRQPLVAQHAEVAAPQDAGDNHRVIAPQRQGLGEDKEQELAALARATWWTSPSRLRRLVSGAPPRVDSRTHRVRCIGDAQIPKVASVAFRILMEALT